MKRYINSKSFNIVRHFILLVLFAFLPFIFSEGLLETETTFRFITTGILITVSFVFVLFGFSAGDITLPAFRRNLFYLILLLFTAFLGFTVLHSVNRGEAIYDYLKVTTIISLFFLFIILIRNTDDFLSLLLRYVNVSIWIFTLITLSQIGLQLKNANHITVTYLLSSSLGNKNFYAETMALFLPLILMGVVKLKGRWRYISIINVVIIVITLIALQTLSTWIAVAVFILFVLSMLIYMSIKNILPIAALKRKGMVALILVPLLIILISFPLLYRFNQFDNIKVRVDKMTEYVRVNDAYKHEDTYHTNSIAERIFLWQNAWRMFKDYPLTGAGLDNWKIYNTKYQLPFSSYMMNNSIRYIRPHNDLMLMLAEGGVIGFVLYIGLFIFAFVLFFRLLRRPDSSVKKILLLLASSGLLIYLVIACVSLPGDRFYTQVLLFLFFAIICAEYELGDIQVPAWRGLVAGICILAIISGVSLSYIGIKRYSSEVHLIYALQGQSKKDWKKMNYHAAMAKNYFFTVDYTATPIAWYQGMAAFNAGSPEIARLYFEEALRSSPYDLNVINDIATTAQVEGDTAKAMKMYDRALEMAPFFSNAFFNKTILLYNSGEEEKAYQFIHTYPRYHDDDDYKRILKYMLSNKVRRIITDTAVARQYLERRIYLIGMDSVSFHDHVSFEQIVLSDTTIAGVKLKMEQKAENIANLKRKMDWANAANAAVAKRKLEQAKAEKLKKKK